MSKIIEEGEYYARNIQEIPVGDCLVVSNNGLYISLEEDITVEIPIGNYGDHSFETITISTCLPDPVDFIGLTEASEIRVTNNEEGAIENIARIAATNIGCVVLNHLIDSNKLYPLVAVFFTEKSVYDHINDNAIKYVKKPSYKEIPKDGGAFNSMIAMGHEIFHAYDYSNNVFNKKMQKIVDTLPSLVL